MNAIIERQNQKIDENLERQHQEEFKGVARAMEESEKYIVLKTIPTDVLLSEIGRRCNLLESRDKAIKELFNIQADD